MSSKAVVAKAIGIALSWYPSTRSWSADEIALTVEQYAGALADLDPKVVLAAIESIGGEWFPALPHVREAAARMQVGQFGMGAVEGWTQVMDAIRKHGAYHGYTTQVEVGMNSRDGLPGAIEDPVAQTVVSALGWNTLCMSENPTADRARFLELYEQKRESVVDRAKLTPSAREVVDRLRVAAGAGSLKQLMGKES